MCEAVPRLWLHLYAGWSFESHTKYLPEKTKTVGGKKIIGKHEWSLKSSDCILFNYYFWDAVKVDFYKGSFQLFVHLDQLKRRIRRMWQHTIDIEHIQRAISAPPPTSEESGGRCQWGAFWIMLINYSSFLDKRVVQIVGGGKFSENLINGGSK